MEATTRQATDREIRAFLKSKPKTTEGYVNHVRISTDGRVSYRIESGRIVQHAETGGTGTGLWYTLSSRKAYRVHLNDGHVECRWHGGMVPGPWTYQEVGLPFPDPTTLFWPKQGMLDALRTWGAGWVLRPNIVDDGVLVYLTSRAQERGECPKPSVIDKRALALTELARIGVAPYSQEDLEGMAT